MAVQELLLVHATNWEQQHSAMHMPVASVAMDEHWGAMAPQTDGGWLMEPPPPTPPVPGVVIRSTHVLEAQVRPALHVPFMKHEHFSLPGWQLEPPSPQPAAKTKAVPNINASSPFVQTMFLISDSPFGSLHHSHSIGS
jgi:hypothetical protein